MNIISKIAPLLIVCLLAQSCQTDKKKALTPLEAEAEKLVNYEVPPRAEIMVVGTFHFRTDVLEPENQNSISQLVSKLSGYKPTKIVLEWVPSRLTEINDDYRSYLAGDFDIADKPNEVYQLGFRLAQELRQDSLYLFDDKTEFIGSLSDFSRGSDPFSFDAFSEYARENDSGFFDQHEKTLIEKFQQNQQVFQNQSIYDQIALRNSPQAQKTNITRMHMYEMRVGIQKNWVGPDWLGRWYRRNIRMTSNLLKMADEEDRILVIVGDNHKWTLDILIENTPDFELASSWDLLKDEGSISKVKGD
ncbi:MAG: hypothetical protein HEP71_11010 [Roseivirga sp.]|nr:hypothetical protein [Roseivirga sp.]